MTEIMMVQEPEGRWVPVLGSHAIRLEDGRYAQLQILGHTHNAVIVRGSGEVLWIPKEQTGEEE
jgi:hypothetical protein